MKKPIFTFTLITCLSSFFTLCWSQPDRSAFLAQLNSLDARMTRLATSDLADFSPDLYNRIEEKNTTLKKEFDRGDLNHNLMSSAMRSLDSLERNAVTAKTHLAVVYRLRNTVNQLDFVRAHSPELYYKTEKEYAEALKMASRGSIDRLRPAARQLRSQYQTLIQSGLQEMKRRRAPALRKYQANLNADLQALNSNLANGQQIEQVNGVIYRLNLGHNAWNNSSLGDLDGLIEPPYLPPLPPKPGPNPPSGVGIDMVTSHSLRFSFTDVSDNETGNRILRSTDLLNWPVIAEVGVVPKFTTHAYADSNLQPETRYCYEVETYNAEGTRKSQFRCAFTNDGNNIGIWRLQLRVRVANIEDAGTDNPLRVIVHNNGSSLSTETILDYGQDDFEKNSDFTYDLNFDNIKELSSITGFQIINYGSEQDYLYIRELSLMVNGHEVFSRVFGNSSSSVLKLGYYGNFSVDHAELRNHPSWQSFIATSLVDKTFNLPPVTTGDNGFQIEISNREIASRIEALMGTLIHTELKGQFKWGHISGDAVEVSQKSADAVHIDLDLEAIIDWSPNPSLDIDFDTKITKVCDNNNPQRMTIRLASENFTTDADFQWWKDVLTLGITKGVADVIDWYAEKCETPPSIERSFDVFLPTGLTCSQLDVRVDESGNLEVCCFSLIP